KCQHRGMVHHERYEYVASILGLSYESFSHSKNMVMQPSLITYCTSVQRVGLHRRFDGRDARAFPAHTLCGNYLQPCQAALFHTGQEAVGGPKGPRSAPSSEYVAAHNNEFF